MKFLLSILLIAILSFAACLFLPWWSIAPAAFIVALVTGIRPSAAFLAGFLALFLLWAGLSFWISNANEHVLAHKVSLVIIKKDSPYVLMIITGLIGGIVAGLGATAGAFLRKSSKV